MNHFNKTIHIIGTGMDGDRTLTLEARRAIEQAELLIGAQRMLKPFEALKKPMLCCYDGRKTAALIADSEYSEIAVLVSGDGGFYSAAGTLLPLLREYRTELISGISTPVYLCAKAGLPWSDMRFVSLHGTDAPFVRMICANLMAMDLHDKHVLDCGSGTGILGICALKLGASSVVAYDIDEWSTDNTRHNAVINGVDSRLQARCGDATLLDTLDQRFDLVLANINRNILLQDMPRFVSVMAPGATMMLSGFYESDCALLESKAQQLGLSLQSTKTDGDWACMLFTL